LFVVLVGSGAFVLVVLTGWPTYKQW